MRMMNQKYNQECFRCGCAWEAHVPHPKQCPDCKSVYWNRPIVIGKTYKCLRCEITWVARVDHPKRCPGCKTSYWNDPKRVPARWFDFHPNGMITQRGSACIGCGTWYPDVVGMNYKGCVHCGSVGCRFESKLIKPADIEMEYTPDMVRTKVGNTPDDAEGKAAVVEVEPVPVVPVEAEPAPRKFRWYQEGK